MIELKKEQIEAAAKAALTYARTDQAKRACPELEWWMDVMTSAAPYLQSPWEMPTEADNERILDDWRGHNATGSDSTLYAVRKFVNRRNAALLPKPVDLTRKKVVAAVEKARRASRLHVGQVLDVPTLIDELCLALDEKPDGS